MNNQELDRLAKQAQQMGILQAPQAAEQPPPIQIPYGGPEAVIAKLVDVGILSARQGFAILFEGKDAKELKWDDSARPPKCQS